MSMGHDAVMIQPASIIAARRSSQPLVDLRAKLITPMPSGLVTRRASASDSVMMLR